jgi:hypothetical protein
MKQLRSIEDFKALKKGDKIHVSDGTPQPPKHHKKKLRTWVCSNYTGFLYEFGYSCGRYEVKVAPSPGGMLVNCYDMNAKTFSHVQ